jgi:coproporphyrinogen III oxidase
MGLQLAKSKSAKEAYALVNELQAYLVAKLDALPPAVATSRFRPIEWLRAKGSFGGGARLTATDELIFNRASVNVSQVQYESDPSKTLGSATAISTIVHPRNPLAPSMHMHISWTELKSGRGYWRMMGDLNPSIPSASDKQAFESAFLGAVGADLYAYGSEQGARYFYIPALGRHRGVAHFYLEEFQSGDAPSDLKLAKRFGLKVIDTYGSMVDRILRANAEVTASDVRQQLEYHSIYFLQVLTLDRGTTSGLLVHDENDVGILGSLPSHVDKALLTSYVQRLPPVQQLLLQSLIDVLPDGVTSLVDDEVKVNLAKATRLFYQKHPEAQELLARADRLPPTQQNHL